MELFIAAPTFVGLCTPDFDDSSVSFVVGHEAASEVSLDLFYLFIAVFEDSILFRRNGYVVDADGNTGYESVMEAEGLDGVKQIAGCLKPSFLKQSLTSLPICFLPMVTPRRC